jgi:hypothetical protein
VPAKVDLGHIGVIPPFSAVLANDGLDIHNLTSEQTEAKWAEYDQLVWLRIQELRRSRDFPGSPGQLNQILAELTIQTHLGAEWVERNIIHPESTGSAGNYLSYGPHSLYMVLSRHRVQELGRRLYQMQSYPWFDAVVGALRTRDQVGLSSNSTCCGHFRLSARTWRLDARVASGAATTMPSHSWADI